MFGKKTRVNRFDRWMMAVTFAEAGDPKTALDAVNQRPKAKNRKQIRRKIKRRVDERPALMA